MAAEETLHLINMNESFLSRSFYLCVSPLAFLTFCKEAVQTLVFLLPNIEHWLDNVILYHLTISRAKDPL